MDTASAPETELEMVRRHILQGADHVARQRARVDRLRTGGLPLEAAEALLAVFEDLQHQHEAHLARIEQGAKVPRGAA
jgi:hypothetical protein